MFDMFSRTVHRKWITFFESIIVNLYTVLPRGSSLDGVKRLLYLKDFFLLLGLHSSYYHLHLFPSLLKQDCIRLSEIYREEHGN